MEKAVRLLLAASLTLGAPGVVSAASLTKTFTVSATVPAPSSVSISASSINAATKVSTLIGGTALSFDPLIFDNTNKIWLPAHYFAIDVGPGGGPGSTDVTVSYTEGLNPNAPGHGLGWKTTATFMKVAGGVETPIAAHGPKKMLKDLSSEHVTTAELGSGILRLYVGVVTKDPTAAIPDPAASEVITNADKTGTYDGSLVISATVTYYKVMCE